MIYQIASGTHISSAILALISGTVVILLAKGTRQHRMFGYFYFVSMVNLNITALTIYNLTGEVGPFHVGALISFSTLIAGFIPVYRRRPVTGWIELHFEFMSWSYVGLLAAGASEAATRLPASPFWLAVIISSMLIFLIGGILIVRKRSKFVTGVWKIGT